MRDLKNYNSFGGQSRVVSLASNPRAKKVKLRIIYLQTFIAENVGNQKKYRFGFGFVFAEFYSLRNCLSVILMIHNCLDWIMDILLKC